MRVLHVKIGHSCWRIYYYRYESWKMGYSLKILEQKIKKQINCGGGIYEKEGFNKKIGQWVVLDDKFDDDKQVTYNGQYMKVGKWDIMYFNRKKKEYQLIQSLNNHKKIFILDIVDHMIKKEDKKDWKMDRID